MPARREEGLPAPDVFVPWSPCQGPMPGACTQPLVVPARQGRSHGMALPTSSFSLSSVSSYRS